MLFMFSSVLSLILIKLVKNEKIKPYEKEQRRI